MRIEAAAEGQDLQDGLGGRARSSPAGRPVRAGRRSGTARGSTVGSGPSGTAVGSSGGAYASSSVQAGVLRPGAPAPSPSGTAARVAGSALRRVRGRPWRPVTRAAPGPGGLAECCADDAGPERMPRRHAVRRRRGHRVRRHSRPGGATTTAHHDRPPSRAASAAMKSRTNLTFAHDPGIQAAPEDRCQGRASVNGGSPSVRGHHGDEVYVCERMAAWRCRGTNGRRTAPRSWSWARTGWRSAAAETRTPARSR